MSEDKGRDAKWGDGLEYERDRRLMVGLRWRMRVMMESILQVWIVKVEDEGEG